MNNRGVTKPSGQESSSTEAAVYSTKEVLLKNLEYSQENTCARVSF